MSIDEMTEQPATWWPRVRLVVSAAILAAGIVGAVNRRPQLVQAARRINGLHIDWLLLAVVFEAVSMIVFAELQRHMLKEGGVCIRRGAMVQITLAANALALSVPGGAAVSTGWSYAELRRRGVERVLAGWAVLMAGALSSFALFLALATGSWVAGSHGPVASLRGLALALAAIPVAAAGVALIRARNPRVRAWITAQAERPKLGRARRLAEQVRIVRPSAGGWAVAAALAAANWAADAGCLAAA
ncbi:MAG: lysylphosphatidylglycerol synthase domain-containing protein, partial [Acidimicrobiales bacterium]